MLDELVSALELGCAEETGAIEVTLSLYHYNVLIMRAMDVYIIKKIIQQLMFLFVFYLFCSVFSQFTHVTGLAVAFGMSTACDTYFSQYHGSVNRHKLGVVLQKGKSLTVLMGN